ncbi:MULTISPECIES: hypothetical protein [unclassified Bradyrhizobium]|uniref:hypothetical protein n=1 Tax=unclassified Bradyrhizobium TaxID=2631580 RepID=UPI0028E5CF39|nr:MULTISPECIES: hypothetical protein [unclassified Bradyrhizobium]
MLNVGDEVVIRVRVVEDHGDDLTVRVEASRGATTVQVGRNDLVGGVIAINHKALQGRAAR